MDSLKDMMTPTMSTHKQYECVGPLPADAPEWVRAMARADKNILGPQWRITSSWEPTTGAPGSRSMKQLWVASRI